MVIYPAIHDITFNNYCYIYVKHLIVILINKNQKNNNNLWYEFSLMVRRGILHREVILHSTVISHKKVILLKI